MTVGTQTCAQFCCDDGNCTGRHCGSPGLEMGERIESQYARVRVCEREIEYVSGPFDVRPDGFKEPGECTHDAMGSVYCLCHCTAQRYSLLSGVLCVCAINHSD